MSVLIGVLLVCAWVSSVLLFVRSVCALNNSPRASSLVCHLQKMLLLAGSAGYFCIAIIAPFDLAWGLMGGCLTLIARGAAVAADLLRAQSAVSPGRIERSPSRGF